MDIDRAPASDGLFQGRFPADTPITPPVIGVSHQQFCNEVKGRDLPGGGSGRGSFDTFPTFVVGDPEARFDTHTPLTYETTGEIGHPIWADIFAYILRQCSYLTAFDTVYVMVDTRNLRSHTTAQDGLPHWPAAVAWWHSRLQLVGPMQEKTELLFFPALNRLGCIVSTRPGQAPSHWRPWWHFFLVLTSSFWIVTACLSGSLNTSMQRQSLRCDKMLPWVSKRATRCLFITSIRGFSIMLS